MMASMRSPCNCFAWIKMNKTKTVAAGTFKACTYFHSADSTTVSVGMVPGGLIYGTTQLPPPALQFPKALGDRTIELTSLSRRLSCD